MAFRIFSCMKYASIEIYLVVISSSDFRKAQSCRKVANSSSAASSRLISGRALVGTDGVLMDPFGVDVLADFGDNIVSISCCLIASVVSLGAYASSCSRTEYTLPDRKSKYLIERWEMIAFSSRIGSSTRASADLCEINPITSSSRLSCVYREMIRVASVSHWFWRCLARLTIPWDPNSWLVVSSTSSKYAATLSYSRVKQVTWGSSRVGSSGSVSISKSLTSSALSL
mmetsp:Transcript_33839/g.132915  ORF Transcript_33839/g.132915 Transcript_33839/m.132915 type:complete len:228 (+) Transcript_33839:1132-1815(+)